MMRLSASVTLLACGLQHLSAASPLSESLLQGASVNGAFDEILQQARADFSHPRGPLKGCAPQGGAPQPDCRRLLKGEPAEAAELLPFLLADEEAMKLWRDHFQRHLKDVVQQAAKDSSSSTDSPLQGPVLKTLAENEFWGSRPAVSNGALAYLSSRMQHMRSEAAKQGLDGAQAVGWEAEVSVRFKYHSIKDAKKLMGTYLTSYSDPEKPAMTLGERLPVKKFPNLKPTEDKNFDAREAFPFCSSVIGKVRDQGNCGSCWAFASTEALNDRFCIKSKGKQSEMLSPQHTTSCCDLLHCLSFGCNGGQPHMAWRWFSNKGVVTGGEYSDLNTGASCWPYEIPFCKHHSDGPFPDCEGPIPPTPKCRRECEETEYTKKVHSFAEDLHFATTAYGVDGREEVKHELKENGTLSGAFLVYEDFLMYKSGVYHHVSGGPLGGHAVKVIGFGNEEGKDYWLAVNSWNEYWGDKGTFKIQMGEAGIDREFCGGEPKLPEEDAAFLMQAAQDL